MNDTIIPNNVPETIQFWFTGVETAHYKLAQSDAVPGVRFLGTNDL